MRTSVDFAITGAPLQPAVADDAMRPILHADRVGIRYARHDTGSTAILQDFSLELLAGEVVALLGPSGVGKSSLLRILAGLQAAQTGQVRLYNQPLNGPHPRTSFVFQDPCLLPRLNVAQNVAFGLDFKHQPTITKAQRQDRVNRALAEVGLSRSATLFPSELSGGMAQRVALARGLARQPDVLLLDEPFSALDEVTRSDMQVLLRDVITRHQASAIVVTHDIDEALILADRIVLIGGAPGRTIGQWTISTPHPRDPLSADAVALRLEILKLLRTQQPH